MAKNSKTQQTDGNGQIDNAVTADVTTTAVKAKKPTKSGAKKTGKAAAKKSGPASSAKKTAPRRATKKKEATEPSDEEIRMRAYFIAERRAQLGQHGDPSNDWLEARQQLVDEAGQSGSG